MTRVAPFERLSLSFESHVRLWRRLATARAGDVRFPLLVRGTRLGRRGARGDWRGFANGPRAYAGGSRRVSRGASLFSN